jgi:hypothetical protein
MAAKSKIINRENFSAYTDETGTEITHDKAQALAESIKKRHVLINQETDKMETEKKELGAISTEIFIQDLGKEKPEVLGNHEYHLSPEQGTVTVNLKVKGRPITEINKKPAGDIVRGLFQEHADKLFSFDKAFEVLTDESTLRGQATEHPECFDIALKPLTHEQKMKLVAEHPDWVAVAITDVKKYADLYPAHVTTKESVSVNNGFIEIAGTMEAVVLTKARKFLSTLLKPMIQTAVVCGNKSKKK